MARVRSSPRDAGRHTGNQYNQGRQFEFDSYRKLRFGPFTAVRPDLMDSRGLVSLARRVVVEDGNGIAGVKDGRPVPLLYEPDAYEHINDDVGATVDAVLGMGSTYVKDEPYRVYFVEDAEDGHLDAHIYDSAGTKTEVSTGVASTGEIVKHVFWGDYVFFFQQGSKRLYKFDFVNPTFSGSYSTVTGLWYMFVLDNNLCFATQDGDNAPVVYWLADGIIPPDVGSASPVFGQNPSPGAGNYAVNVTLGEITGVGLFDNTALVNCKNGAFTMVPTGTLPAFRFAGGDYLPGTRAHNCTSGGASGIVYVGDDGYVYLYQAGQAQRVGTDPPRFDVMSSVVRVFFSRSLNAWLIWNVPDGDRDVRVWLLDGTSFEFISYTDLPYALRGLNVVGEMYYQESTAGARDDFDALVLYANNYQHILIPYGKEYTQTGGNGYATVRVDSHHANVGVPIRLFYVDVAVPRGLEGLIDAGNMSLEVTMRAMNGMSTARTKQATAMNELDDLILYRFPINLIGDQFNFSFTIGADSYPDFVQPSEFTFMYAVVDHIHDSLINV